LLLEQEGVLVFTVDLSISECDGRAVVMLSGELDVLDAAGVVAALAATVACQREIIIDLAGLEFIDSSGLAALAHVRKQARRAGGDVLLAAPQHQVLRILALTRMLDDFSVHASIDEAARRSVSYPLRALCRILLLFFPR
jgi:anti-sigma B factor antagonist